MRLRPPNQPRAAPRAARLAGSGAVGATSLVGVAAAIVTRHDLYARQAGVWSSLKREAGMSLSGEHRA